jgi:hypothetical protein
LPTKLQVEKGKDSTAMSKVRVVLLAMAAVFALSAVAASSASATEVLFSQETGTFEASGATAKLIASNGKEIICTKVTSTGKTTANKHLGEVAFKFTGCTTKEGFITVNCENAGTGEITTSGTFHVGLGMKTSTDSNPGILILPSETTFKCSLVTIKVRGSIVGLIQDASGNPFPVGVALEGKAHIVFTSTGATQADREFLLSLTTPENENMTGITLESSEGGAFTAAGEQANGEITKTSPAGTTLVNG